MHAKNSDSDSCSLPQRDTSFELPEAAVTHCHMHS